MKISGYIGANNYIRRHWMSQTYKYYRNGAAHPVVLASDFKEKSEEIARSLKYPCSVAVSDMKQDKFYFQPANPVLVIAPNVSAIEKSGMYEFSKQGLPSLYEGKLSYIDSALELLFSPEINTGKNYAGALIELIDSCVAKYPFVESETVAEVITKEIITESIENALARWEKIVSSEKKVVALSAFISGSLSERAASLFTLKQTALEETSDMLQGALSILQTNPELIDPVCSLLNTYAARLRPKSYDNCITLKYPVPCLMSFASAYMTFDMSSFEDIALAVSALSFYPDSLLVIVSADEIRSKYLKCIEDVLSKQGSSMYLMWTAATEMWGSSFLLSGDITTERSYMLPDRTKYWFKEHSTQTTKNDFDNKMNLLGKHYGPPAFTNEEPHDVLECFKNRPSIAKFKKENSDTESLFSAVDFTPEEQALVDSIDTSFMHDSLIGRFMEEQTLIKRFVHLPDDTIEKIRNLVIKYDPRIENTCILLNRHFCYEDSEEAKKLLRNSNAEQYNISSHNRAKREVVKELTAFYNEACNIAAEILDKKIGIKERLFVEQRLMLTYNNDLLKLDSANLLTIKKEAKAKVKAILDSVGISTDNEPFFNNMSVDTLFSDFSDMEFDLGDDDFTGLL